MKKTLITMGVIILISFTATSCIFGLQTATGKFTFDLGSFTSVLPSKVTIESKDTAKLVMNKENETPSLPSVDISFPSGSSRKTSDKVAFSWFGYHQKVEDAEFKVTIDILGNKRERTYKYTVKAGKLNEIAFEYGSDSDWN